MVNKVYLDADHYLNFQVVGDQTAETVREMGEKAALYVARLRAEHRPVYIIDNLTHMGHTTSEARAEVARLAKTLDFDRAVLVGDGSRPMRFGTNLMLYAIGRSNIRYFGSHESACKWLTARLPSGNG
jgi:UDP-N-acetylmuramyl pentapeptide synthase